jgi:hypothetical protein
MPNYLPKEGQRRIVERKLPTGVTRNELRKVRSIVSLIGKENLASLPVSAYQCLGSLHVYSWLNEDDEIALSIWDEPKESTTSRCLFADKIRVPAFRAALAFWRQLG